MPKTNEEQLKASIKYLDMHKILPDNIFKEDGEEKLLHSAAVMLAHCAKPEALKALKVLKDANPKDHVISIAYDECMYWCEDEK